MPSSPLPSPCRPTLEIVLTEMPAHLARTYDETAGLALIDLGG
jgi:predicted DNA-binding protein with PD1-like motif